MQKKIIIGIAGRMGCGKGRASAYLIKKYQAQRFRSSDPLREALDIFAIPQSRLYMGKLSTFLRSTCGEDTITQTLVRRIKKSEAEICIFDGMRRKIDEETFRKFGHFTLIFIETDEKMRYERYLKRNENPGDADMSYHEFDQRSNAESEQEIDLLKQKADFIVKNDETLQELEQRIEEIIQKIQKA